VVAASREEEAAAGAAAAGRPGIRYSGFMHSYICTVLLLGLVVTGCANGPQSAEKSAPDRSTYLSKAERLDAVALLPPPPAPDSAAQRLDDARNQQYQQNTTSERWQQAALDARMRLPEAAGAFDCAAGIALSQGAAPLTEGVLRRVSIDTALTVIAPKKKYRRQRPFIVNNEAICTPDAIRQLQRDGSYPSGHAAVGWAWALVLAELMPNKADDILQRGREFGISRAVCNVHWPSDVEQGQLLASALVARLHGSSAFQADIVAARQEIAALPEATGPVGECAQ